MVASRFASINDQLDNQNTLSFSSNFIEPPKFNKRQLHHAIELLSKYHCKIQMELIKNIEKIIPRDKTLYFYDTNSFFNNFTNAEEDYGIKKSGEKILKYELGLDSNNIPIAYYLYNKAKSNNEEENSLGGMVYKIFDNAEIITISNLVNPYTSMITAKNIGSTEYVQPIPISQYNEDIQEWILDSNGWTDFNTGKNYDLNDIKAKINNIKKNPTKTNLLNFTRFYKTKNIIRTSKNAGEKAKYTIVVVYSEQVWQLHIERHKTQLDNIKKNIDAELQKHNKDIEYCIKFLEKYNNYININYPKSKKDDIDVFDLYDFDDKLLAKKTQFLGYYAFELNTNFQNISNIIKIQANKWVNDYAFSNVDSDFLLLPKYINYNDRIDGHFCLAFLGLLAWRVLLYKCKGKIQDAHLMKTLLNLNFISVPGQGWIPAYEPNEITNFLHKILGFNTSYEFIPYDIMNKWIKSTYKKESKDEKKN